MGVRERGEPKRYNLLNVTILHGASKILRLGFIHPRAPNLTSLRSAGTMPA